MNRLLCFFVLICWHLLFQSHIRASAPQLSDKAELSVITCAPGDLIYEGFGHTAIRVNDPVKGYDFVFNYGIFEFNQPNFVLNFARGYLNYKLGVNSFKRFIPIYTRDNRTITEQILNLNPEEKQELFGFLVWNEKPENRYYFYDYFYDNCATRVRDALGEKADLKIIFKDSFQSQEGKTIRELVKDYTHNNKWSRLGIDLCLGWKIDKKIENEVYAFLPEYLMRSLRNAEFADGRAIVAKERTLYKGVPRESTPWYAHPLLIIGLISVALSWPLIKRKNTAPAKFILIVNGLVGVFLMALWFLTDHETAAYNLNLLWAFPLNLLFLPLKKYRKNFFKAMVLIQGLLLLNWFWLPQELNWAFMPWIILSLIASLKMALTWSKD